MVRVDGRVARRAVAEAEFQQVHPGYVFQERLAANVPANGHRRKKAVLGVGPEPRRTVVAGRQREQVLIVVGVVEAAHVRVERPPGEVGADAVDERSLAEVVKLLGFGWDAGHAHRAGLQVILLDGLQGGEVDVVQPEGFAVVQDVFERVVELVFVPGETRRVAAPAGVGLAAGEPAHAAVGKVRPEVDAVLQPVHDFPLAVEAGKEPHPLGEVHLCAGNDFGDGVGAEAIRRGQENQVAVVVVGLAQGVFLQRPAVGVEVVAVLGAVRPDEGAPDFNPLVDLVVDAETEVIAGKILIFDDAFFLEIIPRNGKLRPFAATRSSQVVVLNAARAE